HPVLGRTVLAYVYPIDGRPGYSAEFRLLQVEEAGPEEITPDLSYIAEGVETVEGEQEVEGRRTRYSYLRFAKRAATPIRDYTLRYRTVARCSMSPSGDEAFFYYTCGPYQLGVRDGEIFWQ
ncbi:MAG: hypothetical protein NZ849_00705, partial [Meiothermus sp.]|uniref:hypothetical protein n=1 Tax=Meiothermus sp. TaxID=1955249 RepID=UPI0025DEDA2E